MKLLNDQWTCAVDGLGYDDFAARLRDLILAADTPVAVTIGGRWGSGKTSMLRALMASLGGLADLPKNEDADNQIPAALRPNKAQKNSSKRSGRSGSILGNISTKSSPSFLCSMKYGNRYAGMQR